MASAGAASNPGRRIGYAMIRVMLVDDQQLVRAGLQMICEAEPDLTVVAQAGDGIEAIEILPAAKPDVVLLDVRMPRRDGVETCGLISASASSARVIMLTTFDIDDYVFAALRQGASGFLLKDTPPEDLVHAIRVVARGDALLAPSVTRRLVESLAKGKMLGADPTASAELESLTERETEVFHRLARGMSNAEIADHLMLGEATVKTHVGKVLAKLELRDRVQAVVFAYEHGLVTPGQGSI